jgi:nicotinamidase-related amidase
MGISGRNASPLATAGARSHAKPLVNLDDSVLVVVDLQEGWFTDRLQDEIRTQLLDRAAWIVATARELGIPVIATEEDSARNGATAQAVTDQLPRSAVTFPKTTFDLASDPEILSALDGIGRKTAALIGMETDVCVAQSAAGLAQHGYRVLVVADAVASPGEDHALGLERIRHLRIELISVKSLCYEWTRTVPRARDIRARLTELQTERIRF